MKNVNIREYLYHGICGSNSSFGSLYIFESMLKTGYIVNNLESKKYLKHVAVNDDNLLNDVFELLKKYNYDVSIIEFPSGILKSKNKVLTLER